MLFFFGWSVGGGGGGGGGEDSNKKRLTYLVFFLCVPVLHLPVCGLERCHSVYHYEDLEPEKLNLNIVGNAIKCYEAQPTDK